jgi:UDP-N-acetylmuramate: L-alanyl-gamma-D-glutamyl-meso-diaminopimelate ligase
LPDVEQILTVLGDSVRPGDVVTIMTNGAFGGLHDRLLRSLRSRTEAARER